MLCAGVVEIQIFDNSFLPVAVITRNQQRAPARRAGRDDVKARFAVEALQARQMRGVFLDEVQKDAPRNDRRVGDRIGRIAEPSELAFCAGDRRRCEKIAARMLMIIASSACHSVKRAMRGRIRSRSSCKSRDTDALEADSSVIAHSVFWKGAA